MLRITKLLSCLLLLITVAKGIDVMPQSDHFKSAPTLSHPEEILPAEVWESILDYLPVSGQATLVAVHPFFRDDFFWERRFRLSFPGLPLPIANIKSLCRYVLVTQAIDTKFRDPMAITLRPETYNWILEATFIDSVAEQLKEYVTKIYEARQLLEERIETIKALAGNDPELSRTELYRWYHKAFTAEEGGNCKEKLTFLEEFLIPLDRYSRIRSVYFQDSTKDYLQYWASTGEAFAQRVMADSMISGFSVYPPAVVRAYLKKYPALGYRIAWYLLNRPNLAEDFDLLSEAEIKEYLIERSYKGDQQTQKLLNFAAYRKRLGFTRETGRAYLEKRSQKGDQDAQKRLNMAALNQNLGFTKETGRAYLEERIQKKDQNAQKRLNMAALNQNLGFTKETGRAYLEERIQKKDQNAQKRLNKAAYSKKLGFTKEIGRAYLEERIQKKDQNAQKRLNKAALKEKVGFTAETGRTYLENQAIRGNYWAETALCKAAYKFTLGFTRHTGRQYLEAKAAQGRKSARERLNWAACGGSHGFTEESGKDYLLEQIKKGDGLALLHFYLFKTIREQYGETRLHQYSNCGQPRDEFLSLVDLQDTFQKIKTRDPIDQIAFADFMAEFEPVHAIPVRWFFRFFNILLGRNNDNA